MSTKKEIMAELTERGIKSNAKDKKEDLEALLNAGEGTEKQQNEAVSVGLPVKKVTAQLIDGSWLIKVFAEKDNTIVRTKRIYSGDMAILDAIAKALTEV